MNSSMIVYQDVPLYHQSLTSLSPGPQSPAGPSLAEPRRWSLIGGKSSGSRALMRLILGGQGQYPTDSRESRTLVARDTSLREDKYNPDTIRVMSSSPEMTPMVKLAPMYTIDQILGHNTQPQSRHQTQDHKTSPSIKGETLCNPHS